MTGTEQAKKSLQFYQSVADFFASCPRGNVIASPKIARFRLTHEEFVVYIMLFNELCLRLPPVIREVPYLDISTQSLAEACDLLPITVESALKGIQTKGLIEYTQDSSNLHICVYDISQVA